MSKLTDATVRNLKPKAERYEVSDALVPGLRIVVQPTGSRVWIVRFRQGGKQHKLTLGRAEVLGLAEAREMAREALLKVGKGENPAPQRAGPAQEDTVRAVVERFMEQHVRRNTRPRTQVEVRGLFTRYVLGAWGDRPLRSITRADVHLLLEQIAKRAPTGSNRTLAILKQLFGWCIDHDLLKASPADRIKPKVKEQARDRVLSDDELVRVWNALEEMNPAFKAVVRLLLLLAMRRAEVLGLRWSEVDLEARTITLSKERSKSGTARTIPLSPEAVEVVEALPRLGSEFLFPSARGDGRAISGFSKWKDHLDQRAGVEGWVLHDARRTAATAMQKLGIALPVVEEVLGHLSGSRAGVVGIYQRHRYADEKRAALEAWGRHVRGLLEPESRGVVVPLRG